MEKKEFIKSVAVCVAAASVIILAVLGLAFGKVIEGSLFAEIAKWLFMSVIIIAILEGFVYLAVGPLMWHWYEKKKENDKLD